MNRAARRRTARDVWPQVAPPAYMQRVEAYIARSCFRWFWAQVAIAALLQHSHDVAHAWIFRNGIVVSPWMFVEHDLNDVTL